MTDCCFAQYLSESVYELGAQDTNVWMAQAAEKIFSAERWPLGQVAEHEKIWAL